MWIERGPKLGHTGGAGIRGKPECFLAKNRATGGEQAKVSEMGALWRSRSGPIGKGLGYCLTKCGSHPLVVRRTPVRDDRGGEVAKATGTGVAAGTFLFSFFKEHCLFEG